MNGQGDKGILEDNRFGWMGVAPHQSNKKFQHVLRLHYLK